MSGFLDQKDRVIDMVLTNYGREQLSKGELNFVYWMAFDDEVDYQPFVSDSGSLSQEQRAERRLELLESSPIIEASTGRVSLDYRGRDETNLKRPLFDMPQGQTTLPEMTSDVPEKIEIVVSQKREGDAVTGIATSGITLDYSYLPGSFPKDHAVEGFRVSVLKASEKQSVEIDQRRDLDNRLSISNDLVIDRAE